MPKKYVPQETLEQEIDRKVRERKMCDILSLISAEFKSDPMSTQCFDQCIVKEAIELSDAYDKQARG